MYGGGTFDRDKIVYGETKMGSNSSRKSYEIKCAKHESAFRPVSGLKSGI